MIPSDKAELLRLLNELQDHFDQLKDSPEEESLTHRQIHDRQILLSELQRYQIATCWLQEFVEEYL